MSIVRKFFFILLVFFFLYNFQGLFAYKSSENNENIISSNLNISNRYEVFVGDNSSQLLSSYIPVSFNHRASVSQIIYTAEELNFNGFITQIKFYASLYGDLGNNRPISIWMANTTKSSFNSQNDWLSFSEFISVFDGPVDLHTSGDFILSIPLSVPFHYNGQNLVVMIEHPYESSFYNLQNKWYYKNTPEISNRVITYNSEATIDIESMEMGGSRSSIVPNTSFLYSTEGLATLSGCVRSNGIPIEGAKVSVEGISHYTLSDSQGNYTLSSLDPGSVNVNVFKIGYFPLNIEHIALSANETTSLDLSINNTSEIPISGNIIDQDNQAVSGAIVKLSGYNTYETVTDLFGHFNFAGVYSGVNYTLNIEKTGFQHYSEEIIFTPQQSNLSNLQIYENPDQFSISIGETSSLASQYFPFFYPYNVLTYSLYLSEEIDTGQINFDSETYITSINYHVSLNGSYNGLIPVKMWMMNTDMNLDQLPLPQNMLSQFVLVYDGLVEFNGTGDVYLSIPLDQPFNYNGQNLAVRLYSGFISTDNLISFQCYMSQNANHQNRSIYNFQSSTVNPNNQGGIRTRQIPNIMLDFNTTGFSTLTGTITSDGMPVEGVKIQDIQTHKYTYSDSFGNYQLSYLSTGNHQFLVTKFPYNQNQFTIDLIENQVINHNIELQGLSLLTISGNIIGSANGLTIEGAVIKLEGYEIRETVSDINGNFVFEDLYENQNYKLSIFKEGFQVFSQIFTLGSEDLYMTDILLIENPPAYEIDVFDNPEYSQSDKVPLCLASKKSMSQSIYCKSYLNKTENQIQAGDVITSIKYFVDFNDGTSCQIPIKIWMKNTNISEFRDNMSWIPYHEFHLVYDGLFDYLPSMGSFIDITLSNPYMYEGENLAVMVYSPSNREVSGAQNFFTYSQTNQTNSLYTFTDYYHQDFDIEIPENGNTSNGIPRVRMTLNSDLLCSIEGQIISGNQPIEGVKVSIEGTNRIAITDSLGYYEIKYLRENLISLNISKTGYISQNIANISLIDNEIVVNNIEIYRAPTISLSGIVRANGITELGGVRIRVSGLDFYEIYSDNQGQFIIPSLYVGQSYQITADKEGYRVYKNEQYIVQEEPSNLSINLEENPEYSDIFVGDIFTPYNNNNYPLNLNTNSSVSQCIYLEQELNDQFHLSPGNTISSVRYFSENQLNSQLEIPLKVWLANTTIENFNDLNILPINEFSLVYDGIVKCYEDQPDQIIIDLMQPFVYEGNHIVVMMQTFNNDYNSNNISLKYTNDLYSINRLAFYNSINSIEIDESISFYHLNSFPNISFSFNTVGYSTINGVITSSGLPLEGAEVRITGTHKSAISNSEGYYQINNINPDIVDLSISKHGYIPQQISNMTLSADSNYVINASLDHLETINISGQVNASDTEMGLSQVLIKLNGYGEYQTTSLENGVFVFPAVFSNQSYTMILSKSGYISDTLFINTDVSDLILPAIILLEDTTKIISINASSYNNRITLHWSILNTDQRIEDLSKKSIATPTFSKESVEYPDRAITGFQIWIMNEVSQSNPETWTEIASNINSSQFTYYMNSYSAGEYRFAIRALFENGQTSDIFYSNITEYNMLVDASFQIATSTGQTPIGSRIYLINNDGINNHNRYSEVTDGVVNINQVRIGNYKVMVKKNNFLLHVEENIRIDSTGYVHPLITLEPARIYFSEDFNYFDFVTSNWTVYSLDDNNYNWVIGNINESPLLESDFVSSVNYYSNIGIVNTDNWLISPPINLDANFLYELNYDLEGYPSLNNSIYSVLIYSPDSPISQFNDDILSNFEAIDIETSTEFNAILNEYAGRIIYIAFRHYNSPLPSRLILDNLEVLSSLSPATATETIISEDKTRLIGNYPNPFNPETRICFELKHQEDISLEIFNIKGQKVKTLLNNKLDKGVHQIIWNGRDDSDHQVSSGIYFYRLKAGKTLLTRKMMLLK